jgi:hypothetical protein
MASVETRNRYWLYESHGTPEICPTNSLRIRTAPDPLPVAAAIGAADDVVTTALGSSSGEEQDSGYGSVAALGLGRPELRYKGC